MTEDGMRFADQFSAKDLHIVPGSSPGGILCRLGISWGNMCVAEDDLSCGPLMSLENPDDFRKLRWQHCGKEEDADASERSHLRTPFIPMDRLHTARDRVRSAKRIFLWLGTTLQEQLLFAWLVTVFKVLGIGTGPLQLLDLKSPRQEFDRSIRTLGCENIRKMARWRRPAEGELASYEVAWQAVSNPSPEDLIAMSAPDLQHPVALNEALHAFMARYPANDTGLNYWDRVILANCRQHGRKAARIIGETLAQDLQYPDWPSDGYRFDRLKRLGSDRLSHPLLTLTGDLSAMRFVEAAITDLGQKALVGEANFVALNGIDEWVGGVHLSARAGSPWVFDGETLVPGGAP